MNRRKRPLALVSALLVVLAALACWRVYQQYEQERKDQAVPFSARTAFSFFIALSPDGVHLPLDYPFSRCF